MKWNWKGIEVEGHPTELLQLMEQKGTETKTETKATVKLAERPTVTRTTQRLFKPRNRRYKQWSDSEHNFLMENWLGRDSNVRRKIMVKNNLRTAKILGRTYFGCSVHYKKHRKFFSKLARLEK